MCYFRTTKFAEYGKLSHQNIEELQLGIRVGVDDRKENRRILFYGRLLSQARSFGRVLGERAAQAGILNAPLWCANI